MNKKILLAEDDENLGIVLTDFLSMKGFEVKLAINPPRHPIQHGIMTALQHTHQLDTIPAYAFILKRAIFEIEFCVRGKILVQDRPPISDNSTFRFFST